MQLCGATLDESGSLNEVSLCLGQPGKCHGCKGPVRLLVKPLSLGEPDSVVCQVRCLQAGRMLLRSCRLAARLPAQSRHFCSVSHNEAVPLQEQCLSSKSCKQKAQPERHRISYTLRVLTWSAALFQVTSARQCAVLQACSRVQPMPQLPFTSHASTQEVATCATHSSRCTRLDGTKGVLSGLHHRRSAPAETPAPP